jgi:hypothetical protein
MADLSERDKQGLERLIRHSSQAVPRMSGALRPRRSSPGRAAYPHGGPEKASNWSGEINLKSSFYTAVPVGEGRAERLCSY